MAAYHFTGSVVEGAPYRHVLLEKPAASATRLHVYLDGDGTPWQRWAPAPDPTPRDALVLALMAMDPAPSVYLGRPCYHGLAADPQCTPAVWTVQRYSDTVVSSMARALERVIQARRVDRLIWIGYSGGGVLAMLLAPRFPHTRAVVTVAANLDIDAWADHHGYARLTESVNPRNRPALPSSVYQRHYVGARDRVVPPAIAAGAGVNPAQVTVVPDYDHACCWRNIWPVVLTDVTSWGD